MLLTSGQAGRGVGLGIVFGLSLALVDGVVFRKKLEMDFHLATFIRTWDRNRGGWIAQDLNDSSTELRGVRRRSIEAVTVFSRSFPTRKSVWCRIGSRSGPRPL